MKVTFVKSLAIVVAMIAGSSAFGQGYYDGSDSVIDPVSYLGGGDKGCDDDCGKGGKSCGKGGCGILDGLGCGCGPSLYAEFDAMFLRYNRADGVQDIQNVAAPGTPNPGAYNFNYRFTPRITLGFVTANGTGFRVRYFDYNHARTNTVPFTRTARVDTFNIDAEMFRNIDLTCSTQMQWSIGARYNDFTESVSVHPAFGAPYRLKFDGWGVITGLGITQKIRWGSIYGRARGALLTNNRQTRIGNAELAQNNVTTGMIELAVGWQTQRYLNNGALLTFGIGYEIQQWMNYGIATPNNIAAPVVMTSPVDVGFDGIVLNFAYSY